MDVIAHQDRGADQNAFGVAEAVQQIDMRMAVVIGDEGRSAIHATLGHVQRRCWQFHTSTARHEQTLIRRPGKLAGTLGGNRSAIYPSRCRKKTTAVVSFSGVV